MWAPILLQGWGALETVGTHSILEEVSEVLGICTVQRLFHWAAHRLARMWLYYECGLQNSHCAAPAHPLWSAILILNQAQKPSDNIKQLDKKTVTQNNSKLSFSGQCSLMQRMQYAVFQIQAGLNFLTSTSWSMATEPSPSPLTRTGGSGKLHWKDSETRIYFLIFNN